MKRLALISAMLAAGNAPAQEFAVTAAAVDYYSRAPLTAIRTAYAYDTLKLTGAGVRVGVLDSGIDLTHKEFSDRILAARSFIASEPGADDLNGHGTHVAGIIAAAADGNMTQGVAPGATLIPVKVMGANGGGSTAIIGQGMSYAISNGARILNMSLGWTGGPAAVADFRSAVGKGALLVAAAGNSGTANPDWPARYAKETWANGQIIAVGSVNANNVMSTFSNRAGDTRDFYLVAPGERIASTYKDGQYAYMSGTSMATPAVSGAAALLMQYWPKLNANQVAGVLFKSATDLGAPGIDAVYGRGLLNLDAALRPVGTVSLPGSSGNTAVTTTTIVASAGVYAAVKKAGLDGAFKTTVLDEFERDYSADFSSSVALAGPSIQDRLAQFSQPVTPVTGDRVTLGFDAGRYYGHGLQHPFLADAAGSLFGALALDGIQEGLKVGFLAGAGEANVHSTRGLVLEWDTGMGGTGDHVLSLQLGHASESSAFLGSTSEGALGLGAGRTTFVSLSGSGALSDNWRLVASAHYGSTSSSGTSGMVTRLSGVRSLGASLGLVGDGTLVRGDRATLSLSVPLKTVGGVMGVEQSSYDSDGNLVHSVNNFSLKSSATEVDFALGYRFSPSKLDTLSASLMRRLNPGNDAALPAESIAMLSWRGRF
jgi:hypothetical protein